MSDEFDDLLDLQPVELDPRLLALASGTLSASERAALLADAEDDPALQLAIEAHTPLGDAFVDSVVVDALAASASAPAPANDRRGYLVLFAAAVALFAAISSWPTSPDPTYALEVEGLVASVRGDPGTTLPQDGSLRLGLRPSTGTDAVPALRVELHRDGRTTELAVTPEVRGEGYLVVELPGERLGGPGTAQVVVIVGDQRLERELRITP
jgi:hypothetical protein